MQQNQGDLINAFLATLLWDNTLSNEMIVSSLSIADTQLNQKHISAKTLATLLKSKLPKTETRQ